MTNFAARFARWLALVPVAVLSIAAALPPAAYAQQTLGGITGTVSDTSGSVIPGAQVTAVEASTHLRRTTTTSDTGSYVLNNLPIGHYDVTVTREGFQTARFPDLEVQGERTLGLPATLAVGSVAQSVTVDVQPLLNVVDTTNGYILEQQQIESIPQATGSFTGLATLSPGVNAELPSGTGANAGLGNLPIWANGQRDTANSFYLNGVNGATLFNGKSTSNVGSARVINSTGVSTSQGGAGVIQSTASIYLSIGNSIPTPAPEFIQEERVNASLYDAAQGATSGAHIDLSTASGTNAFHGSVYGRRGTDWINAAPFFFKQDESVPANKKTPQLHRYDLGATVGGPIVKDKLFFFAGYQYLHVSDEELGDGFLNVPIGLSDTNRNAAGFAGVVNNGFGTTLTGADIDRTALALFNIPSLPGEPGKWLIPNDNGAQLSPAHPFNAFLPGTARFKAQLGVADLDYNASPKDTLAVKYFYQLDPTIAPYAYSSVPGFAEHQDAGSQVVSITNSYQLKNNLSTAQSLGFGREKIFTRNEQPFTPQSIPNGLGAPVSINTFGSTYFPGVSIVNVLGDTAYADGLESTGILNIGPNAEGQASNLGVFQNRLEPAASAIWTLGRHAVSFGTDYSYTQLNTIDHRTGTGTVATDDLSAYAQGLVTPGGSSTAFYVTSFLQGNANRYYRANQLGLFVQDKYQVRPNLSLTAGLRYDWDGGLTEKNGRLFNFDPTLYSYSAAGDVINNPGFIIAGNNANGTSGVSNTTLTGRQWGFAPRIGAAWQPSAFHDKVVVRTGFGMYYDRGELFTYFSPGYAIGTVTGGPFGVNQQLPFVNNQTCAGTQFYNGYIPTCDGTNAGGNLANPYGGTRQAAPSNPRASDLSKYLPNATAIANDFAQPVSLGVYDRANKLPYTMNYTLDVQWQPSNDLAIDLAYVGNLGRHQVIPVPFNQPTLASAGNPALKGTANQQNYSYGYTVVDQFYDPVQLPNGQTYQETYEGGNVDLRVPYIGYAAESIDYKAAGVDAFNALELHVDKRMHHGIGLGASYTYSHALDEQSGLGLFYNGNNPNNLRGGYASADFDRTHVLTFTYTFQLPSLVSEGSVAHYFANGWQLTGLTVLESGQPYSVIDFSGAVGSLFYSTNNGITNPIVPLAPGCNAKNALTGKSGAFADTALKSNCFTVPLVAAGGLGGAVPGNDPYETNFTSGQRNIFRSAFQKRADASLIKTTKLTERYSLRYTFDVYNLTNTSSFDVPGNEVEQNENFNNVPVQGTAPADFYNAPFGVGVVTHTIGSPRQVQMSLALKF